MPLQSERPSLFSMFEDVVFGSEFCLEVVFWQRNVKPRIGKEEEKAAMCFNESHTECRGESRDELIPLTVFRRLL